MLCTLVMDIQLYCQKYYFGRLAENYFTDLHQDVEEKLNVREGKNKITPQAVAKRPEFFSCDTYHISDITYH